MKVRSHQRLEARFSNESGIQEDDPLQAETIKKLTNLLTNCSPINNINSGSSAEDTSNSCFYNERCESTLFGSTSVDGSSLNLSSSDNTTHMVSSETSSNGSLGSESTLTGVSYDSESSGSLTLSDCTVSASSEESAAFLAAIGKIEELDGDFRVDTPPPNPVLGKPVQKVRKQ